MPRRANYHIPAPKKQARAPGAAYCGAMGPYKVPNRLRMRRWVVEMAQLGRASSFCHRCLAGMLEDANRAMEFGAKGASTRNTRMTPEARLESIHKALEARWTRYRARKAEAARAHLSIVPTQQAEDSAPQAGKDGGRY